MLKTLAYTTSFALLLQVPVTLADDEITSSLAQQKAVHVTIYNSNLALIKDTRVVTLNSGLNHLALKGVSAKMRPETALLKSKTKGSNISLLEQNFDFDLLTPQKLLQKYVGKTVTLISQNPKTGVEIAEKAKVLAANKGPVLQVGNRIEAGNINGRIVYDSIPDNLRDRPTLVTQLVNKGPRKQTLELSYLSGGLDWKADYVAELSKDNQRMNLSGWVTLNNQSGTSYQNAQLQLVAGDVNRVQPQMHRMAKMAHADVAMAEAVPMQEESLLDYHLYTLPRATTIKDQQTKQVALLNAYDIPVNKTLLLRGNQYYYRSQQGRIGQKMKLDVMVDFSNKKTHNLGLAIPKGVVRVYKNDTAGRAQFVGEDRIDHTAKNDDIRLKLGQSFDVTATRVQTDFERISRSGQVYESAYRITFNNGKQTAETVTVQEPMQGDWKIISENKPHQKVSSRLAQWKISVPAEGKATLIYRARVKY